MPAARRPESREQTLAAALASLTEDNIPPAGQGRLARPGTDPLAGLAALSDAEL